MQCGPAKVEDVDETRGESTYKVVTESHRMHYLNQVAALCLAVVSVV